ncbi:MULTISPECIES: Cna B-type domain-containing protein [Aerococcus]|uniref:Cna B-type domain-containing protein n=1 Tax=Aerococcus tenax TaxID=3078812 RepID=A0A5N1BLY6_9LACT|nr:Cna B-type domain-containing protein [Aerococcus urinae]KAA9241105.1 Cna B-type domain-containing protein [Aerococcus urinae]MDK6597915.1 Cna B-type domain-containing protein [Aerococcus urinae]MDK7302685.1 Cna B-type domain-containing protein [Aerococcus urinae]MDK7801531.1 Cna B-type domain-containing protein [Aerococcus urinae]MDK8654929.1 Cna B-type domain-containing protein [Aerococcus urinae]
MKKGFTALLLAIAMLIFSFMPTLVEAKELGPPIANQEVMAINEVNDQDKVTPSSESHKEVNSIEKKDTTSQVAGHVKEGGDQEPATLKENTQPVQASAVASDGAHAINSRATEEEKPSTKTLQAKRVKEEEIPKNVEEPVQASATREADKANKLPDQAVDVAERSAPKHHDDVITGVSVTKANGQQVNSAYQWMTIKVNMDFQLPDNTIKAGDITTIHLPKELVFKDTPDRFGVKDSTGAVVARGYVNPQSKTITLSYTDYVEKHSGIKGTLFFSTRVDHTKEKKAKNIPLNFKIGNQLIFAGNIRWQGVKRAKAYPLQKDAWKSRLGDNIIQYRISINRKGQDIYNGAISDALVSEKVEYIKNSLRVYKGKWQWNDNKSDFDFNHGVNVTPQVKITWGANDKDFKIHFGHLRPDQGLMITYRAQIGYQALDGEVIKNYVQLTGDGINNEEGVSRYRYISAGGKAQGYVYQIKLIKSDQADPNKTLAGAKFKLIRNRTGALIGEYETNQAGEIVIKNLLRDAYTLKESQAPVGYQLDPRPIAIGAEDFDNPEKLAIKSITNKKVEEKLSIPVTKFWIGKMLKEVTVFLKADGEKIQEGKISVDTFWMHTFENLAKFKPDGSPIEYTVEEAPVAGYRTDIRQNVAGDVSRGFIITNTEIPFRIPRREIKVTKAWLNSQGESLNAPVDKIEVELYRDGQATGKQVTLSAENHWSGSFKNLPVYESIENPTAYDYSVKEVGEDKGSIQVNGHWFKASYSGTIKDGFTVVNQESPSWTPMTPPTRELKVMKTWLNSQGESLNAPVDKLEVELYRDGQATGKKVTLSGENHWNGAFKDLPVYESIENTKAYKYSTKEVGEAKGSIQVAGKWFKVTYQGSMKDGFQVVNQESPSWTPMTPPSREIKVMKTWLNVQGESLSAPVDKIEVELYHDGQTTGKKVTLSAKNHWSGSFKDLPVYESIENTKAYDYSIKEVGEAKGSIQVAGKWFKVSYQGTMKDGFKVVNQETPSWTPMTPPNREIKVTKTWLNAQGESLNAPVDKIEVELYRDGQATGKKLALLADNQWSGSFKKLPVYESIENPKPYEYSVKEVGEDKGSIQVNGHWFKVTYQGTMKDGFTIRNQESPSWTPMTPPTREVKVTKTWLNAQGESLNAPVDKLEIELYRNGQTTGKKLTLSVENQWRGSFNNLPAYESIKNPKAYEYSVKEVGEDKGSIQVAGKWFKAIYQGTMKDGFAILNQETPSWTPMTPPSREVKVTKSWLNAQGESLSAPVDKIEVELYRDDQATGKKLTVSAENNWSGSFKNLPVYESIENPTAYDYSVKEVGEDKGSIQVAGKWFKVTYSGMMKDGFTILNQETPTWTPMTSPFRELKVTKTWLNAQGESLSAPVDKIEVELYRDGQTTGKKLALLADNQWSGSFKNLPVYESIENPTAYDYSVKELGEDKGSIQVNGHWFKVTYSGMMKDGFTIRNQESPSWTPMTPPSREIKVTKKWVTAQGESLNTPVDKLEVELYSDGQTTGKKVTLSAKNHWSGSFKDLPVYESIENTKAYDYSIKEVGEAKGSIQVAGKWFKVSYQGTMKDGFTILNQETPTWTPMTPPSREIKVMKTWLNVQGESLNAPVDKLEVELYRNGQTTGKKLTLSVENQWSGSFKNLPVYESIENTKAYEYSIKEIGEDKGSIQVTGHWFKVIYQGTMKDGFTILNQEIPSWTPMTPPTRELKVTKAWLNAQGESLISPVDKIEVELYRDGQATGKKLILSAENHWTGAFKDLPVYESIENTKAYAYSIKEVGEDKGAIQVSSKWFKVSYQGTMKDGFKVVNQETPSWTPMTPPSREIKVTKKWVTAQGESLSAPVDNIQVELYRDGQATGKKLTLSAENHWSGSFKDLPVYESIENTKAYEYSIKEVSEYKGSIQIAGECFKVTYLGRMKDGFKVVNQAYPPEEPQTPPDKPKKPETPPVTPPDKPKKPETPPVTPPDKPKKPETPPVTPPDKPKKPETPPVTPPDKAKKPETPPVTPPDKAKKPETPPVTPPDKPKKPENPPITSTKVDHPVTNPSQPAQKQVHKEAGLPKTGLDSETQEWLVLGLGAVFVGCLFAWLGKNNKSKR